MSASYKTPGVYVEEIAKLPPSIAQVETAIPAFIGYTEKDDSEKTSGAATLGTPTRITSLLEYESYFGKAFQETGVTAAVVEKTVNNQIVKTVDVSVTAPRSPFLMYYAMQMYFANGGGPCYIMSVGDYSLSTVSFDKLKQGLQKIEKEDEPTLLLFPDATALSPAECYSIYNEALKQSKKLQDRFTIIDTHTDDENAKPVDTLRNSINLEKEYLKYGAAYYPYLQTSLKYSFDLSAVAITHATEAAKSSTELDEVTLLLDKIKEEKIKASPSISAITSVKDGLPAGTNDLFDSKTAVIAKITDINTLAASVTAAADSIASLTAGSEVTAVAAASVNLSDKTATVNFITTLEAEIETIKEAADNDAVKTSAEAAITALATLEATIDEIISLATAVSQALTDSLPATSNGSLHGLKLALIESKDNAVYNDILKQLSMQTVCLPPSSAMAGVYARVDRDRGVWKAPANAGLTYVVKPTVKITNDMQDSLNIDTVSGKSVNAIRSFAGKGPVVWGARTLAGNDNEWRYISVRRFFNMVEESVKKATNEFVFEANDANTWVKVRAMIENYLSLQWRAGALAGAKTDEAFYVRVGYETTSSQDILNGIMNIEIGMAVVRPAEFIVLKFSHKLQEA